METNKKPLFSLGRTLITPGAIEVLENAGISGLELLARHLSGDWGDLCKADKEENELSLKEGFRILSSYTLTTGQRLWVITEADRSATTILRPDEY